jgi:hypothetical protein
MALIGFIFLFIVGVFASLVFLLLCTQTLGQYNIGGVPNKWPAKVGTFLLGIALVYAWVFLFACAPLTI